MTLNVKNGSLVTHLPYLREGKRGTCLGPPFVTVMCKVAYLAFK